MLPTQARTSHTGPQGCFVHCWNVCVERCLRLHPIRTMHTGPIHEVPTYTHQPNSHFPHGWCTIYVPTIHPFHRHFVNFPTPRRCHACSESGHIAAFGCSCPPNHPHPGVTPLKHWPQRPTTTLQLPPATFCSCACAHLHLQPDHAAFGPAHPSLPFQHLGQFGPPLAPKAILPVGWCTH